MSWLVAALLAVSTGVPAAEQPMTATVSTPSAVSACVQTELPVTIDNTAGPARDVQLILYTGEAQVELLDKTGYGERVPSQAGAPGELWSYRGPTVALPAQVSSVFRFRVAFSGGQQPPARVAVVAPAEPTPRLTPDNSAKIAVTGPKLIVDRPLPERLSTAESHLLGVHVRNDSDSHYPELSVEVSSQNPPSNKYRGFQGWTVEAAVGQDPWQPLALSAFYGWRGHVALGTLARGANRDMRVKFQSTLEKGRLPMDLRLKAGECVLAAEGFQVEFFEGPPPPLDGGSSALFWFRLAAVISAFALVVGWLLFQRRSSRNGHADQVPDAVGDGHGDDSAGDVPGDRG